MSQSVSDGYAGFADPGDSGSQYNQVRFAVQQMLAEHNSATVVKVVKCSNAGGLAAVGFVDVVPQVHQIDGDGKPTPHGTIYHLPYFRVQGGANAVVIDPAPGDLGVAVFADRDISSVKANKDASLPGSRRTNDMADGMYFGGLLNGAPTQYVMLDGTGVTVVSPTKVTIQAPQVTIQSDDVQITGASLKHNGHDVGSTHRHRDVQTGGGISGVPQ